MLDLRRLVFSFAGRMISVINSVEFYFDLEFAPFISRYLSFNSCAVKSKYKGRRSAISSAVHLMQQSFIGFDPFGIFSDFIPALRRNARRYGSSTSEMRRSHLLPRPPPHAARVARLSFRSHNSCTYIRTHGEHNRARGRGHGGEKPSREHERS